MRGNQLFAFALFSGVLANMLLAGCSAPMKCCDPKLNCCEDDKNCCDPPGICKVCRPETEKVKVKNTCFMVECKDICIPAVKFPWDDCCEAKCGKVIKVRVLKKHEYECEQCETTWNIEEVPTCCNKGCNTGCCTTPCQTGCCAQGPAMMVPESPMHQEAPPPLPPPPVNSTGRIFLPRG